MDSGEEIPNLNEGWTLLGFKLFEFIAGFVAFGLISEVFFNNNVGTKAPYFFITLFGTAVLLRALRTRFEDEERGARNYMMTLCGFAPPNMPAPSVIQQIWSASPVRELSSHKEFVTLGLKEVFSSKKNAEEE